MNDDTDLVSLYEAAEAKVRELEETNTEAKAYIEQLQKEITDLKWGDKLPVVKTGHC